jgi:phosphoribosylanthranilate isomerase
MIPRLKVCCIGSIVEAQLAMAYGADAVGLVAAMPSGPGPIADELITEIAALVPPPVATFLLTSRTTAGDIAAHVQLTRPTAVQIVSHIDIGEYVALRRLLPGTKLVQVVHVENADSVDLARRYADVADLLLLDSGRPGLNELGGTGRVHDWEMSARIVADVHVPVFLAGGLTPENVTQAVALVRPFGVDLCSGLRTQGRLDAAKLAAFTHALWNTA